MTPTRTCVGCRKARPADQLVRIVRGTDGTLSVDRNGPGRGAWLCGGSPGCLQEALRRHAFDRAFAVSTAAGDVEQLRVQLAEAWGDRRPDVRG